MANELELMAAHMHLRNGGDVGFLERIPEKSMGRVDNTPINTAYSAVQSLHKRGTHRTRLAQELQRHLCAPENSSVIWSARVSPFVALSLALHHEHIFFLIHASFLPRHQNTHYNRDNTIYSKNTQCIINFSQNDQSKSNAIKNHSVVKTSRVVETRAKHSPQVMSPKILRLSPGSRG